MCGLHSNEIYSLNYGCSIYTEMDPQGSRVALDFISFGRALGVEFKAPLPQLIEQLELMLSKYRNGINAMNHEQNETYSTNTTFPNAFY